MQLSKETIEYVENSVKTAKLVEIKDLSFSNNQVRGVNAKKTAFLLEENVTFEELGNLSIGINRADIFTSRFELAQSKDDLKIEAKVREGTDYINSLELKAKGIKVQYGCCDPTFIKSPQTINDAPVNSVGFSDEFVNLLMKAKNAVDGEVVEIKNENGKISFSMMDLTNDIIEINEELENTSEVNFNFKYGISVLSVLMKNADNHEFTVSQKGLLMIIVNGLTFYLLPQA